MDVNKDMIELITKLEYILGNQCYNPNSYNGWTGEEGCSFRYPVYFCSTKEDLEQRNLSKERGRIEKISPECIETMKYKFGSNHLYVGDAVVKILSAIENRYGIDFNELEQIKIGEQIQKMEEIRNRLEAGEVIEFTSGTYKVGRDLPEGEYFVTPGEKVYCYAYIKVENTRGNIAIKEINIGKSKKIKLGRDYNVDAYDAFKLSKVKL